LITVLARDVTMGWADGFVRPRG